MCVCVLCVVVMCIYFACDTMVMGRAHPLEIRMDKMWAWVVFLGPWESAGSLGQGHALAERGHVPYIVCSPPPFFHDNFMKSNSWKGEARGG